MRIAFDYSWFDDAKTVMVYRARDNWNWKDYHAVVRASLFSFHEHPNPVHMLIDLSTGKRDRFPSGAAAHMQTFGKKLSANLSGKAVVIGVPDDVLAKLSLQDGVMTTADGSVHFVADESAAAELFAMWQA